MSATVTNLAEHVAQRKRSRSIMPTTSEAFERAWLAFPESGRRRSSRIEAWPAWRQLISELGEEKLEAACVAFGQSKIEDCGAPGFHRWLKWGRWEHWLDVAAQPIAQQNRFPDESLRAAFYAKFEDGQARRWFDRAEWSEENRQFIAPWPPKAEWWDGPFARWAQENDIRRRGIKTP